MAQCHTVIKSDIIKAVYIFFLDFGSGKLHIMLDTGQEYIYLMSSSSSCAVTNATRIVDAFPLTQCNYRHVSS